MTGVEGLQQDFKGKNVLIFGLGLLGRGLGDTIFFRSIGCEVRVTDLKSKQQLQESIDKLAGMSVGYTLGEHKQEDIEWADVVVRNASVPWKHPLLEKARELGKEVVMDSQLFMKYAPNQVQVIGVTGTRGKTTTSTLIATVLQKTLEHQVILGGNVRGIATLPQLKTIKDPTKTIAVLELSSWQLQAFGAAGISPHIAVVTNIYPDHLNSYDSMEEYVDDKKQIFLHQKKSDHVFFNKQQQHICEKWMNQVTSTAHWFDPSDMPKNFSWSLKGEHNLENAAASLAVCTQLGVNAERVLEVMKSFSAIENRLAYIGQVNQAEVYNDSNSTTPVATIKALESFDSKVALILGGEDKKLPIDELVEVIDQRASRVYLLDGSGTKRIADLLDSKLVRFASANFVQLVNRALADLAPGEILVFSPGFTSFNLFINEYDRGDRFCQLVKDFDEKKIEQESQNKNA